MTKRIAYFEYGQVYPPLVDGAPPLVPAEPEAQPPAPELLRLRRLLALFWYVCHAALVGAVIVTILVDAEGYCTSPLQPIAAIPTALLLWTVTLFMRRQARKETS